VISSQLIIHSFRAYLSFLINVLLCLFDPLNFSYYAEIVIKRNGEILHREGGTFLKKILAKTWSAKRDLELQQQDVFSASKKLIFSELINVCFDN